MSTETTNKKIKIDNGTTFGRTYTDKAVDEMLQSVGGSAIFEITSEQASKLFKEFDITDEQYQFIINNKSVSCLLKIQGTSAEFPVAFTRIIQNNKITAYFSMGIYFALSCESSDVNPATNKHVLRFQSNMMDFYASLFINENEQNYDIYGTQYITYFDTIKGANILHEHNTDPKDWQFTEDKTIPLFGKHSILAPKDSADTNILPCTPSDNGKVLSVVNGEAQWANVGGGSGGEGGISVIELTDKNGTIATAQLDEINANPQNFAFKYNGKILLFTSADSTTYQYCNNTTSSSDNSVMTTSTLLTITSSTGAYTIAENVHNVVANSIHPANGGDLTNIQVGTKVYSIPSGTIIITHDSPEYTISIPLKEYALGDTITLKEYSLTPKKFFSTISFYAVIDNVIEITGVKFLITYSIFKFGLRTIATCIKSGTVTENKVYKLSYTYATRE